VIVLSGGGVAAAHGPVAPVATSYEARVGHVPAGLDAKVIDGYVRMWLQVPAAETVEVLDYRNVPYLRFTRAGVEVNHNSEMWYLNQSPVAQAPPRSLNKTTPPDWHRASGGHAYEWHDGRLQAFADVATAPGTAYVGRWQIPMLANGTRDDVTGGLWHRDSPSIVWFWPIVVLLACVLAAWRIGNLKLDARVTTILAAAGLAAIAAAAAGRGLHGRPGVSAGQYLELAVVGVFVAWALARVVLGRAGFAVHFMIAAVAIWEGFNLLPTLLHGYVLIDLPAFPARAVTVLCLGCGTSLLLTMFRLADRPQQPGDKRQLRR
jgi:hypothetical protein